ncbi:MAG: hypothetical protein K2I15_02730 [Bacteroides sp.]|nr:hypothetical protein [Bacteroides sp.]
MNVWSNTSFVYIYQGDKNKAKWYYIGESTVEKIATVEDQIWFYTQPFLPDMEPTLLNVNQTGLPTGRPSATNNNYTFAWCVPSIVGYQLMEKMDRFYKEHDIKDRGFDPEYPISKWISYWTSNATTADIGTSGKYPEELKIDGNTVRSFTNLAWDWMRLQKMLCIRHITLYPERQLLHTA